MKVCSRLDAIRKWVKVYDWVSINLMYSENKEKSVTGKEVEVTHFKWVFSIWGWHGGLVFVSV